MIMPKPMAAERVHDVVLSLLEGDKTGRVLDAAAGEGYLTLKLKNMGFDVTPCDINTKNFRIDHVKIDELNLNETLPYEDNTFDYIVSVETIEHIENPNKLINNFHRILVPGGELILTTPNICNISSRALFLMKCDFHRFGDYEDHITPLPWFILKRLLENNGFEIDSIFTNKFVRPRKSIIFYLLFPFYSNKDPILQFGDILIIKAKKVKM